jgi:hypothetical protein
MNSISQLWDLVECAVVSKETASKENPVLKMTYSAVLRFFNLAGDPVGTSLQSVDREPGIRDPLPTRTQEDTMN